MTFTPSIPCSPAWGASMPAGASRGRPLLRPRLRPGARPPRVEPLFEELGYRDQPDRAVWSWRRPSRRRRLVEKVAGATGLPAAASP